MCVPVGADACVCLCVCTCAPVLRVLKGIPEVETGAGSRRAIAVGAQCRWLIWLESAVCGVQRDRQEPGWEGPGAGQGRPAGGSGGGFRVGE